MRIHTYVIAVDSGAAPNYDPPCTTLAVCKPRIRRKATVGEVVLAFAGKHVNPFEPHTVVWAGVVAEKMPFADYWNDRRFSRKKPDRSSTPDNFYRPTEDGGLLWIENPVHPRENAQHDLSGLNVLAFDPSWRFGSSGPVMPVEFGLRMTNGRRGERLLELSDAGWRRLRAWLDEQSQLETAPSSIGKRCRSRTVIAPKPERKQRPSKC